MNITFQMNENGNVYNVWELQALRVNCQPLESCYVLEIISEIEKETDISGFTEFFYGKRFACNPDFRIRAETEASGQTIVLSPVYLMLPLNASTTICAGTLLTGTEPVQDFQTESYSPEEMEFFLRLEEETRE